MKRISCIAAAIVGALCWVAAMQSPVRADGAADAATQSNVINL